VDWGAWKHLGRHWIGRPRHGRGDLLGSHRCQRRSQHPTVDGGVWGGLVQRAAAHVRLEGATLENLQGSPE
jgi:hypothetical protein